MELYFVEFDFSGTGWDLDPDFEPNNHGGASYEMCAAFIKDEFFEHEYPTASYRITPADAQ